MKILMINSVCGIRSTGRICTDLAAALEEKGHEVKIAYGRETAPKEYQKYAVRIGNDMDVKLHALKARLFDASGFGSKRATLTFIEWVKTYDPDVIHLHNLHGYYINIEILFNYLKTCGKRIVWTLHDCWAFTGHSPYCDSVGCEKWKSGCGNCPIITDYPKAFVDRSKDQWERKKLLMTGIPNMVIATPSEWLKQLTNESFLGKYDVTVVKNDVDTTHFYPRKSQFKERFGIENKTMLLGVATSWTEMKGFSDYLKLSEMLDERYQLVMVGLSKKQIAKIPDNILGLPRTNNIEELAEIYRAADMLINLSYCESYGLTNLEARLCGTPVITYSSGGCIETAGEEGIIVKRGSLDEVIEAIEKQPKSKPIIPSRKDLNSAVKYNRLYVD